MFLTHRQHADTNFDQHSLGDVTDRSRSLSPVPQEHQPETSPGKETELLNKALAEEGRDIGNVSISRGAKVELKPQHGEPGDTYEAPTERSGSPSDLSSLPLLP